MTQYINVTQLVDSETEYDFNGNTGIYIAGLGGFGYTLLWFDGENRQDQLVAIDRLIASLESLKTAPAYVEPEEVPA